MIRTLNFLLLLLLLRIFSFVIHYFVVLTVQSRIASVNTKSTRLSGLSWGATKRSVFRFAHEVLFLMYALELNALN